MLIGFTVRSKTFCFISVKHLIKPGTKAEADLDRIMNVDVRQALGIEQSWQDSSSSVFSALYGDFMKPVTDRGNEEIYFLPIFHFDLVKTNHGISF